MRASDSVIYSDIARVISLRIIIIKSNKSQEMFLGIVQKVVPLVCS